MPEPGRSELVPLIDLLPEQAGQVSDAMANVGIDVVVRRVGVSDDSDGLSRALRLFVPRHQLRDARAVVRGVLPQYRSPGSTAESSPVEDSGIDSQDDQWAQIVSELQAEGVGEEAPPVPRTPAAAPVAHDDRYVPPEPPPLPRLGKVALASWIGLLGGIALVVIGTLVGSTGLLVPVGVVLFVGGFIALVARAAPHRRDSGSDDGAVL